jgi:DNA-directed RNA polymerase specialized sigma24 family protein
VQKENLDKMLRMLGPSEEAAALEYRRLHQRLSRFFEWNSVEDPTALADEAIDRLARRTLERDANEPIENPTAFVLSIARFLLLEESREQRKKQEALQSWNAQHHESAGTEAEVIDAALQHCLAKMHPDRCRLIERYYLHEGRDKARDHRELASELGLTVNALRNRALRARQELEACLRKSLTTIGQ